MSELTPEMTAQLRLQADADLLGRSAAGGAVFPILLFLVGVATRFAKDHPTLYWTFVAAVSVSLVIRVALAFLQKAAPKRRRWTMLGPLLFALSLSTSSAGILFAVALATYGFINWTFILILIQVVGIATGSTISFAPNLRILNANLLILLGPVIVYAFFLANEESTAFAFSALVMLSFLLIQGYRLNAMYWNLQVDRALEAERLRELQEAKTLTDEAHEEALFHATYDALTAVFNRRAILSRLEAVLDDPSPDALSVSILMLDIDNFKRINDTFGHLAGDNVIRCVADRLKQSVRDRDSIGRYGGEEFLVILPGCGADQIVSSAERIRTAIASQPILAGGFPIQVTISIGAVFSTTNWQPGLKLLSLADKALYQAKNTGRNRVVTTLYAPAREIVAGAI